MVLGNSFIPPKYEKFFPNTESFSRSVKLNIKPAVGVENKHHELVVIQEGVVKV